MTQEEKAKAYDEAIRKAKITLGCCNSASIITKHTIYDIFPELKESEDERIRKALVRFHKSSIDIDGIKGEDILAWLEKQESVGEIVERCKNSWYNEGKIAGMAEGLTDDEKYQQGWHDALEKQGEQKPQRMISAEAKEAMYNKPTDKVEPKFKVGDWITNGRCTWKIDFIENGLYYQTDGDIEYGGDIESIDKEYHHWTLADAKDGDILQLGASTVIFKEYIGQGKCIYYCSICNHGVFKIPKINNNDNVYGTTFYTYPATKERRDTLMKAMSDAGWEFDFEKKELKEIEQKSAWSEEDERICHAIICDIANDKSICKFENSKSICDEQINWLKSLKEKIGG